MKTADQVVLGPVITERSYALYQLGRYTFRVASDATKPEIAAALEQHYSAQGIRVVAVNTVHVRGKTRRSGRRGISGKTSDWKKAIVTLGPGQKLEGLFGSV
ncbi:MAG: 50S ribosomal protein L23 [Chloroflexi bacterium]|jgi:large subunit ribosomal protein L23|nr:MAG: 50S ribosomal protein L23 [Chloroflexota bacterium]